MTQPNTSTLARKYKLQVNTGTVSVPTWTDCLALADFKPANAPTIQDDTVYDDAGWGSQTKTLLMWSVEAKFIRRANPNDPTVYDVGQEKLRACSLAFGASGVAQIRYYDRTGGPEAYTGFAEVTWTPDGGDGKALETVSVTLSGKGALTLITNPEAFALPVPSVTAVSPATGLAAGGTLVKITGDYFSGLVGAAAVKFGANNASSYFVQDTRTIYAVAPAHAAGTVDVTVTNPTGTSATAGTANDYVYT